MHRHRAIRIALAAALAAAATLTAAAPAPTAPRGSARRAERGDRSLPLARIAPMKAAAGANLVVEPPPAPATLEQRVAQRPDPAAQEWLGAPLIPAPEVSFDGPSNTSNVFPAHPVGDVGPGHYVAMSNRSFAVYSKTGTLLYGPAANNTLWSGFGGACEAENPGQGMVVYDQFADRWLLAQTTAAGPTRYLCVALSTSGDPTGSYDRWAFPTGTHLPDAPRLGVWRDAYYLTTRELDGVAFVGVGAHALDRAGMLAGELAPRAVSFLLLAADWEAALGDGLLPADVDGATLPPAGAPALLLGTMDDGAVLGATQDALQLWRFHVDFATPEDSTLTAAEPLPMVAPFDTLFTSGCTGCIPQPGTATQLDVLAYKQRPQHRLAYRSFGDHEALVANQSVEGAENLAGIRWWEVRDPNGTPTLHQEGTYVPGATDGIHRWLGSAAMDVEGNLALGYSAASATQAPSVRYTGRLVADDPGTLPQGEEILHPGAGSQTASGAWGTTSAMAVDAADDCAFWYVNEYLPASGGNWRLRIGSFRFAECDQPDFTLAVFPSAQAICAGQPASFDVDLGALRGFESEVTLALGGQPAGTTAGFAPTAVTPPGSSTLTLSGTGAVPAESYLLEVSGTAAGVTHSANAALEVDAPLAGGPTLSAPADGATDQAIAPTLSWSAVAGASSYLVEVDDSLDFSSPEFSSSQSATSAVATGLAPLQRYFWRVTAENACGTEVSTTFDFTTAALFCRAPGVAIPDGNAAGVDDTLTIAANGSVLDLDVLVKIDHTYVGDLKVALSHNGGTALMMIDRPGEPPGFGCEHDDIDVRIDDEGTDGAVEAACNATPPAISGDRVGTAALSFFDGQALSGTWTLNAADFSGGDDGSLIEWCLVPTVDPMPFADDFETGDLSRWSSFVPVP